jgi:hypothetical protein
MLPREEYSLITIVDKGRKYVRVLEAAAAAGAAEELVGEPDVAAHGAHGGAVHGRHGRGRGRASS